jgi:transposase
MAYRWLREGYAMGYNFFEYNREQQYLMPPSLKEWVPEGDLAWFVLDAVKQMDLNEFYKRYRADGSGAAGFDPEIMVELVMYAYCVGERSSRKIERLCERDVAFRVVAANLVPDHSTISRFRKEHREALGKLFTEVLRMCGEAGLVKVGVVAIDGTKMEANASLAANRTHDGLQAEVEKMLNEADAIDAAEDALYGEGRRGDELPEDMRHRESRLKRLKEAKERLEREAAEAARSKAEGIARREEEERESGKKKRGRKPLEPDKNPDAEAKANITDPESRIMKTRRGYVQGYNAQTAVTEGQIIISAEVTQEENDMGQMHPMLDKAEEELKAAGIEDEIGHALFDAGYCSEDNLSKTAEDGPEIFAATTKDWKQRKAQKELGSPRGRIPKGLTLRELMERKLLTKKGQEMYGKRKIIVEPPFGQMKEGQGFRRFMMRGVRSVASEWRLMCASHNMLKLWRSGIRKAFGKRDMTPALAMC